MVFPVLLAKIWCVRCLAGSGASCVVRVESGCLGE